MGEWMVAFGLFFHHRDTEGTEVFSFATEYTEFFASERN